MEQTEGLRRKGGGWEGRDEPENLYKSVPNPCDFSPREMRLHPPSHTMGARKVF